ncbi:MAG: hypothetical protein PHZ04_02715 [Patescibacteria group bacterium]|nr:hypothetical protein [Patescibacteria group bacterium]MDD5295184.1 hypothetical protein [Patescibacteria group bacterium]MDD5554617.1 hypothetical protein [Patescibacteria group bacterium]
MSAPVWKVLSIPLKDGEGKLEILVQQWKKPDKTKLKLIRLNSELLITHSCFGLMKFIEVSKDKNILHCVVCSLRISLPSSIKTLGELEEYLLNA